MSIQDSQNFLLHEQHDLQIAERERTTKSRERGRGRRAAELKPERERQPASWRESGGQRAGERAAAGERERERRLSSGRESGGRRAGERVTAKQLTKSLVAFCLRELEEKKGTVQWRRRRRLRDPDTTSLQPSE
ncbi:hypothetical protein FH972_008022 [Carpinus fangiana]|uniref:Uncharacterized protein n=1 Tax=Carpinus fangiana TaxID=176857 RepID=A0A5N6QY80_9ROSI|nr:hypothetical protein FH972_008022 [Carpinus fangiana]